MQRPTLQQTIGELERELATRDRAYPRWIREGKITEETANQRRDCISEAIRLLDELCLLTRRADATQLTFADPGDCPTHPRSPRRLPPKGREGNLLTLLRKKRDDFNI
jgi:hypothetical protein